jgi:hypothetical protein
MNPSVSSSSREIESCKGRREIADAEPGLEGVMMAVDKLEERMSRPIAIADPIVSSCWEMKTMTRNI